MIPGSKGQKFDASLLAGEFFDLGTRQNMSKLAIFQRKMSGLRMFLKIAGAYSAEQSGIRGVKMPFDPNIFDINFYCNHK